MTIICAIRQGDTVHIGSDRQVLLGGVAQPVSGGKWMRLESGWWVGFSGFGCRLQVLAWALSEKSYDAAGLAQRLRQLVLADEWKPYEPEPGPQAHRLSALFARPGELWEMTADFGIIRTPCEQLATVGCGSELALGAAHALRSMPARPKDIITAAVGAACYHSGACGFGVWQRTLQ